MPPREDSTRLPRAVPWLWAAFAASILANLVIYFGYFVLLPHAPDFEAGRTSRVHLGGQTHVYGRAREARIQELVQVWGFFGGAAAFFGACFLSRNVPLEPE